ncbi:MAG: ABC transporter permease [Clostridiales bacterium]|nr:ABC transporter permease [Clostridiales bacterium]
MREKIISFLKNVPAVILAVSIIMCIVSVICIVSGYRSRPERNQASVWSQGGETSFRHVAVYSRGARSGGDKTPSVYTEYGQSLAKTDIYNMRKVLQGVVDSASGVRRRSTDKPIDPEGWTDAFCSFVRADLVCTHQDFEINSEADIYAVSGNYRAFHPFEFLSGGFLPVQDVDKYQIVLNDELAWKFFSSYDVIGERVTLWDREYTIIGVVDEHDDRALRAYVYFDCLEEYCSSSETPVTPAVLSYEVMMPESVDGVAVIDVRNSIPGYNISSPGFYVVSITDRFAPGNVIDHMTPPGEMRNFLSGYELPFWEMSAQQTMTDMFVWMIVFAVFLFVALVTVILILGQKLSKARPDAEKVE